MKTTLLVLSLVMSSLALADDISVSINGKTYQCSGSASGGGSVRIAHYYSGSNCTGTRLLSITETEDCDSLTGIVYFPSYAYYRISGGECKQSNFSGDNSRASVCKNTQF